MQKLTPALRIAVLLYAPALLLATEPRQEELMMPARDGVELATSVYLPAGESRPLPCILARTPYGKGSLRDLARKFVERGYAFAAQDCRGKGGSKGRYDPFREDHRDGHDAVEWVAARPWCDGRVGMMGASALGITATLAATQAPPHLACAYVVVAEGCARHGTVYNGGVYRKELNDGWLASQGAFGAIAESVRRAPADPHWDWRELPELAPRVRIPIYQVGGWFDIFAQGNLDAFRAFQEEGAGLAAGNQRLVMGPWAHGALGGRLKFPGDEMDRYLLGEEMFRWFDRWLKEEKNGIDREPPVRYYLLGKADDPAAAGGWRTAETWPPPARPVSLFLASGKSLAAEPPAEAGSIAYSYDPRKTVITRGGANLLLGGKGPMDQRDIGEREDYLRFATAPLTGPVEVAGRIVVDLHVESDCPDTDFAAKLVDVHPDGYEALLTDGIIRARYREGLEKEVFLKPGEAVPLRIDLGSTAAVFAAGHRIAIHITSSNDPRYDPNPNTGKPLRADTEVRTARNTIHLGAGRPSRALIPVMKGSVTGALVKEGEKKRGERGF